MILYLHFVLVSKLINNYKLNPYFLLLNMYECLQQNLEYVSDYLFARLLSKPNNVYQISFESKYVGWLALCHVLMWSTQTSSYSLLFFSKDTTHKNRWCTFIRFILFLEERVWWSLLHLTFRILLLLFSALNWVCLPSTAICKGEKLYFDIKNNYFVLIVNRPFYNYKK